ncbi:IS5 family transposase [Gloeocapsopsis dulcis]|uniref:IS5 family transposase n=1 Tax=Gloeocapsopsis dulcis TaxID=2859516 RepID=UPI002B25D008|nr:IS5 family transposase [Gloeocapsopsis dulcis]WNN87308.1 IS5 family transposase [Gloeocapsopsis dulcis]WNN89438.1 IS5 family transposase [Gloeocapsopsis dulcis]WNN90770.1 IS5 family transposase [Gloeocapsopsis dulcis]WNN90921.1 IS5 family transposase [Gloeocapsopsis dulcis]
MVLSPQTRQFYRAKERAAKRYSSDLTDQEWEVIRPLLPSRSQGRGRKQQVDEREILNGIFYQLRNGCIWSDLPKDLPAWQTVYKYFRRWQRKGVWQQIHDQLRQSVRGAAGRNPHASAGCIDSQTVKTTEKRGGLRLRRWQISERTQALYPSGHVGTADLSTGNQCQLLRTKRGAFVVHEMAQADAQTLQLVWVDQGYQGENFARVIEQLCGAKVEVVRRSEAGFVVLPKRWVVERTFGWLNQNRRLSKDYELLPEVSEAMIQGAMIRLMLQRLGEQYEATSSFI